MSKQEIKNLGNGTKRQRIIVGSIVEIPIDKEYYVYAQILSHGGYAFFDCRYEKPLHDLSERNHRDLSLRFQSTNKTVEGDCKSQTHNSRIANSAEQRKSVNAYRI